MYAEMLVVTHFLYMLRQHFCKRFRTRNLVILFLRCHPEPPRFQFHFSSAAASLIDPNQAQPAVKTAGLIALLGWLRKRSKRNWITVWTAP